MPIFPPPPNLGGDRRGTAPQLRGQAGSSPGDDSRGRALELTQRVQPFLTDSCPTGFQFPLNLALSCFLSEYDGEARKSERGLRGRGGFWRRGKDVVTWSCPPVGRAWTELTDVEGGPVYSRCLIKAVGSLSSLTQSSLLT